MNRNSRIWWTLVTNMVSGIDTTVSCCSIFEKKTFNSFGTQYTVIFISFIQSHECKQHGCQCLESRINYVYIIGYYEQRIALYRKCYKLKLQVLLLYVFKNNTHGVRDSNHCVLLLDGNTFKDNDT